MTGFNNTTITYENPKFLEKKVEILEGTLFETIERLEWLEAEWNNLKVLTGMPFNEAQDFVDYVERLKNQIKK
tara:strand:+ start:4249 stop:4467 length:219 start_codon:yes stop_codon:yes gene_type:complete